MRALRDWRADPDRLGLWLLILLGGVIRLWGVGGKSLWVDEAQALWVSQHGLSWIREFCAQPGAHESPARYFLMHILAGAGPNTAFAVRLPAVLGGVALIPVIWTLAGRLSGGARLARWSAALFAVLSPVLVEHSQDARYYTVMLALEFGGLLALLAAWERPRLWGLWVAAGLASALAFYVSFTAAFVVAATVLTTLAIAAGVFPLARSNARTLVRSHGPILALICFALPMLPWLPPTLRALAQFVGLRSPPPAVPLVLGYTPLGTPHVPEWTSDWVREILHPVLPFAAVLVILAVLGISAIARRAPRLLLPLGLIALVTPALVLGTAMRANMAPRYLLHLHVLALVLAGCGLSWVAGRTTPRRAAAVALAVLLAAAMLPSLWRQLTTERQNWRGAVEFIEAHARPGDMVITGAYWSERPVEHYLDDPMLRGRLMEHVMAEADFGRLVLLNSSIWYVGWGEIPPFIQQILDRDFHLAARFPGTRGDVFVWKKGPIPEARGAE